MAGPHGGLGPEVLRWIGHLAAQRVAPAHRRAFVAQHRAWGRAVRIADAAGHLPIGLMANAVVRRKVPAGAMLAMDDVEMPDQSLAHRAWRELEADCLAPATVSRAATAAVG